MISEQWSSEGLCFDHPNNRLWFSYKKSDIEEAKQICKKCPVRVECLISGWNSGMYATYGGVSEYEYLITTWKEASNEREGNRTRADRLLKKLLQEIK